MGIKSLLLVPGVVNRNKKIYKYAFFLNVMSFLKF